MTGTTLRITEGDPTRSPFGSRAAQERIEAYIRFRWGSRTVEYIAEGPGYWEPPLQPTTVATVERWQDGAWQITSPDIAALGGYILPGTGPYRVTGTVGYNLDPNAGPVAIVPAAVSEAHHRLEEYFRLIDVESTGSANFRNIKRHGEDGPPPPNQPQSPVTLLQGVEELSDRPTNWKARALQLSGAADLLRKYRRLV